MTLLILAVIATTYTDAGPLYCGGMTDTVGTPWIAIPVEAYTSGAARCGDLYYVRFADGSAMMARALDAGDFGENCVQIDDRCVPIAADVPAAHWPFAGLSMGVELYNVTAAAREAGVH